MCCVGKAAIDGSARPNDVFVMHTDFMAFVSCQRRLRAKLSSERILLPFLGNKMPFASTALVSIPVTSRAGDGRDGVSPIFREAYFKHYGHPHPCRSRSDSESDASMVSDLPRQLRHLDRRNAVSSERRLCVPPTSLLRSAFPLRRPGFASGVLAIRTRSST